MNTYVTFMFWLYVIVFVIQTLIVSTNEYPRTIKISLGFDIAKLIFYIPFLYWTSQLLWGNL